LLKSKNKTSNKRSVLMKKIFKDKKVVIMGLGLHGGGVGVTKFFAKQGADVLVTDLKTKSQLKKSVNKLKKLPIKFVLGKHREEDFIKADLIIKGPAVPPNSKYLKAARDNNISIKTDIQIFFDLFKGEIIGVTGTKGKSTAATLIYLFLKQKHKNVFLAGNIGITPLEIFNKIDKKSKIVLELSSFELENLKQSPHVAVITTLFEDHLNRYKNLKEYIKAKKPIFKYQNKNDILFLNKDNVYTKKLAEEAKSKVIFFPEGKAALSVAKFYKISQKSIKKVLASFKGVPHRQELIAVKKGVKYINDTAATTPESAVLAIKKFKKDCNNLILIAGGQDKNLKYKNLAKEIRKNVDYLILFPGTASDKIKKELKKFNYYNAKSMEKAVKKAVSLSKKKDIVLLSPGAASFGLFKNEFDRGAQFKKYV